MFLLAAPSDYTGIHNKSLQFISTESHTTVFVPIIDDTDIESRERFFASIQVINSVGVATTLNPTRATVDIISNDCMSYV